MGVSNVRVAIFLCKRPIFACFVIDKPWLRFFGAPPPLLQASAHVPAPVTTVARNRREDFIFIGAAWLPVWKITIKYS
jgi:hypothetical protein